MSDLGFGAQNQTVPGLTSTGVTGANDNGVLNTTIGPDTTAPADPDVIPVNGDSSTTEQQIYGDPGMGDRGDPPPQPPSSDPADPSNATFANLDGQADSEDDAPEAEDGGEFSEEDIGQIQGEDGESPEWADPPAGGVPTDQTPPSGGTPSDDTSFDAPVPPGDVIPVNGDSSTTEEQIWADPGLGDRGDPPPPPPPSPSVNDDGLREYVRRKTEEAERQRQKAEEDAEAAKTDADYIPAEYRNPNPQPSPSPRPVIPIVLGAVLVLGALGFAVKSIASGPGAAPTAPAPSLAAPTLAPTATSVPSAASTAVPAPAARVTDTKIAEQGNVCLNQTVMTAVARIEGAKPGDTVVFALSGPGLPATASGQLDASGGVSAPMGTVGPVKGNQTWSAAVQSIGGKDVASGPSQVFGFCPNN